MADSIVCLIVFSLVLLFYFVWEIIMCIVWRLTDYFLIKFFVDYHCSFTPHISFYEKLLNHVEQ